MRNRLDTHVQESIKCYRKRERALKKIEELYRKDAWAVAMEIRLMTHQQAKLWRRSCRERYDIDLRCWLAEDPADLSSLTRSRGSRETAAIMKHAFAYAHWECVQALTSAAESAAIELEIDKDKAICGFYVGWLRHGWSSVDWWHQFYSELPPNLKEELLTDEAGWVGSRLKLYPRLYTALSGWGRPVFENLARELPGAVFAAYGSLAEYEQLNRSILTEVSESLADMGSESASRQDKLTGLPPEVAPNAPEDEQMAELEHKEMLDALERAAGLSPQQVAVWQRLRQGELISEIAAELGISENSVSVQKHNAIKKMKEAKRAAEL